MTERLFEITHTLAVGVTGHRTLAAAERVQANLAEVLSTLSGALTTSARARSPRLRLLSPLAEGADRLFAEVGLASGGELHCVLPFGRDDYEADFASAESRASFRTLLGRAERVLELDGDPAAREDAYLQAGRLLVSHCDVLIAVWDGQDGRGRGGTADIVTQALREELIVVLLDPDGDRRPEIIDHHHHSRRIALGELPTQIQQLLSPPPAARGPRSPVELSTFLAERQSSAGFGAIFDLFTDAVSLRMRRRPRSAADWLETSRADWRHTPPVEPQLASVFASCAEGDVAEVFARADTLARHYAGFYRSTFVMNFLLSVLAVLIAVVGAPQPHIAATVAEFAVIVLIIVLTWRANRENWHERWIEYRHLAEQVRPLRFLFPLGLNLPKGHIGRPLQGKDQPSAWIDWLTRRLERDLGLPSAKIDPSYLKDLNSFAVTTVLDGQIGYHTANAARFHTVDHRLHVIGLSLFQLTAAVCAIELVFQLLPQAAPPIHWLHALQPLLFRLSGISPAFGAAILGIRNVGEFTRLERRSRAMASALGHTRTHLGAGAVMATREQFASHLLAIAAQMMSETADWRTLVITRRIEWPG